MCSSLKKRDHSTKKKAALEINYSVSTFNMQNSWSFFLVIWDWSSLYKGFRCSEPCVFKSKVAPQPFTKSYVGKASLWLFFFCHIVESKIVPGASVSISITTQLLNIAALKNSKRCFILLLWPRWAFSSTKTQHLGFRANLRRPIRRHVEMKLLDEFSWWINLKWCSLFPSLMDCSFCLQNSRIFLPMFYASFWCLPQLN